MKLTEVIGGEVELRNYFVDVVKPINGVPEEQDGEGGEWMPNHQVSLYRYSVLGSDPQHAINRFLQEDAGVEVENSPPTEMIIVGITESTNPFR
jgi:hypothetical protein